MVFPACAGMIPATLPWRNAPRSVPRMRGDDPRQRDFGLCAAVVFPACAGMIPAVRSYDIVGYGVPRMRGDDPPKVATDLIDRLCSPHARG